VLQVVSPFVVEVVEEQVDAVVLRDRRGITARLHSSILTDNGLELHGGRVVLPGSVYRHYFGKRVVEIRAAREREDVSVLVRNIERLLHSAVDIRRSPELASAYSTAWHSAGIPIGIWAFFSLGTLAEYWLRGELVQPCPHCGEPAYAFRIIGSFMSGRADGRGVCPRCRSAVTFHPWRGPRPAKLTGLIQKESQVLFIGQEKRPRPRGLDMASERIREELPGPRPPRIFLPADIDVPPTRFLRPGEVVSRLAPPRY
jgi:hypothetical protein